MVKVKHPGSQRVNDLTLGAIGETGRGNDSFASERLSLKSSLPSADREPMNGEPTFARPRNWLMWIPLVLGIAMALTYTSRQWKLAVSWLGFGTSLAALGHAVATDKTRAYRIYSEYLRKKEALPSAERIEWLKEARQEFRHPAIVFELGLLLFENQRWSEAFDIVENFGNENIGVDARRRLQLARAEILLQLGHRERAEYVLEKLLADEPALEPARLLKARLHGAPAVPTTRRAA